MGHEMRFRSLLLTMLLLIIFSGQGHATKSKSEGIGIRFSVAGDISDFSGARSDGLNQTYVSYDETINSQHQTRFPIYYQFKEELLTSWAYTKGFFDFTTKKIIDLPPKLRSGIRFDDQINKNSSGQIVINSNLTYIDEFKINYPKYASTIDSLNEPSLSVDFTANTVAYGKEWGVFIPIERNHRILSLGLGIGGVLLDGKYDLNVCDPYIINPTREEDDLIFGIATVNYRNGICTNKNKLYSSSIPFSGIGIYRSTVLYEYINENYDLKLLDIINVAYISIENLDTFLSYESSNKIQPTIGDVYIDLVSIVWNL